MSITPAERKALLFLASLLTLGAAARFVSALRHERLASAQRDSSGLSTQIAAVDSERSRERRARRRPSRRRSSRTPASANAASKGSDSVVIVDVDRASAAELELLPRVGPALAKRIVNDRDEHGAFGSLAALTRVKGIGPKLVTRIAAHVTFSGSVRPSSALSVSPGSAPHAGRPPPPG